MAENKRPPDLEERHNPQLHHEPSDVDTRALTRFGIIFALGLVASLFLVWFVFDYFKGREERKGPPPSAMLNRDARRLPPEPRLQASPVQDLSQMKAAEQQLLDGYAWIDPANGLVRIPVSRALDLVAKEGLPSRSQTAPLATGTATVPTESGLGPIVHQEGGPLSANRKFPPDQPLEIRGTGDFKDGRQAGGPPTPPENALGK